MLLFKTIFCLSLALGANTWGATSATTPATTPATTSVTTPVTTPATRSNTITHYTYEVVAERSHKKQLFTQGLVLHNNHFYESSGQYGQSFLAVYPVAEPDNKWAQLSAKFTRQTKLHPQYFAEGIALFRDRIYQLTWREQTLLIWDRKTLELQQTLAYSGEGWGLTHDNTHLIRSDGSHRLTFHEAQGFTPIRVVEVHENGHPLSRLNELEYIQGKIWANIWYENRLVEIDPETGKVIGSVDLSQLARDVKLDDNEHVLNGIAYDEKQQALWVTGKGWPKMFLIRLN